MRDGRPGQRPAHAGRREGGHGAHLLRGELDLRPRDPEGSGDHPKDEGADPLDHRGGGALRLPCAGLRQLAVLRRRLDRGQGHASPHDGALPQAGGGRWQRAWRPSGRVGVGRTHELTRLPDYEDKGYFRTDYVDVEDWGLMHVTFTDGTIADVYASEIVMGGVHNWLEVFANNHRTRCNINPMDGVETYNPKDEQFKDVYVVEKIGTKQGWSKPAPDENWMNGYVQEMGQFYGCMRSGETPVTTASSASTPWRSCIRPTCPRSARDRRSKSCWSKGGPPPRCVL